MSAALRPIVMWGATGHAKVLNEFLPGLGFQVVALFDNSREVVSPFPGVPIFHGTQGFEAWRSAYRGGAVSGLVAIGGDKGADRLEIQARFQGAGITLAVVVHPTAFVARDAVIGPGSQVLANASVGTQVRIGRGCIVNTGAIVDHEGVLGDGVHLAPGAVLTGCVEVGSETMIGAGAVVLPRLKIGRNSILGAGAVATRSLPDDVVAYGNPARVIRAK